MATFRTNELVSAFVWGGTKGKASGGRLYIEDDKIINYATTLAQRVDGKVFVNMTKYSRSTTVHQNRLLREIGPHAIEVTGVPMGAYDLQSYVKGA